MESGRLKGPKGVDLTDKKIALLGFGIENISLAKFLLKNDIDFVVLDQIAIDQLSEEARDVIEQKKIKSITGVDYLSHLKDFDVIVRSPGVKYLLPEIQSAKEVGKEITSSTKLFFEMCPAKIIGVTGTKGKGTTASLIFQIIERNFQISRSKSQKGKRNVYLVGNIGIPSFDIIDKVTKDDLVVFELSSFQLQDMDRSPWIAVVVNIAGDHLDYHKTLDEYRDTKKNILRHQMKNDFAVLNYDYPESRKLEKNVVGKHFFFSSKTEIENGAYVDENNMVVLSVGGEYPICSSSEIKLIGRHNLENIAAASIVATLLKIEPEVIRQAVVEFSGLPHRLEFVRETEGVMFYNDSFSTNPSPTIAAVNAFAAPITLIVGGSEKGADFTEMADVIKNSSVKNVLTIGIEGPRIRKALSQAGAKINILNGGGDINQIAQKALQVSCDGEVILFSPACASFDMFKNYKDRGEKFKQAVKNL